MLDNCLFCKIIKGEIPSTKILENDSFVSFLDISQATEGHTLVIPKLHSNDFNSTTSNVLSDIMSFTQLVANKLKETYNFTDYNILINNGPKSGQIVYHLHVHIIPRKNKDEMTIKSNVKVELQDSINKLKESY